MRQHNVFRRALSLLLVLAMLAGFVYPVEATGANSKPRFELEQIENSAVTAQRPMNHMGTVSTEDTGSLNMDQIVRVSIQLEKAPTIDAGFALKGIGQNANAMAYRDGLAREQAQLQAAIERQALNGQKLDVVWNLTLAANLISANVPRGSIETISAIDGVKAVVLEKRYEPQVVSAGGEYDPNMAISGQMTGSIQTWQAGYTGAGSRIAVIDTGLDTDHQSFDAAAFEYALEQVEAEKNVRYDVLDTQELETLLPQLNAYKRAVENGQELTASDLYINSKAAYGYNYVDGNLDVTHDNDDQGEHGSHVAGIATANRYLQKDGAFVDALEEVLVAGAAPDAQVLVMKVFGKEGGAYDSDIMVSIEDAMILGADSVNLSLGSVSAGTSSIADPTYQALMDRVVESGMVVVASAGNDGSWADYTTTGYLYADGVNFDTVGDPGSYTTSMAVASVDNDGMIGPSLVAGGTSMGYSESLVDSYGYAFGNAPLATLDTTADGSGTEYEFVLVDGFGTAGDYADMDLTGKIALCSRGGDVYYYEKANAAAELGAAALVVYNNEPGLVNMDLSGYNYSIPVVFISQSNAAAIQAVGTRQATEAGRTYVTGKLTVRSRASGNYENSLYKTMSSFSSWGVPGSLELKPDITAPGGNIYSVNGAVPETDQYEFMSGTSMSAPQISGLVALVKEYLREKNIQVENLNARGLTQSLLMSTAEPMRNGANGSYYPVIQQGAGLANVLAAIQTPVYLTVEGLTDGMVKVELGDDPQRTGLYTFRFALHNLTQEPYSYQLYADVFTQDVFQDDSGTAYLDTLTRAMDAQVDFAVNGVSLSAPNERNMDFDFNGDSRITRDDGQHLLDHVTLGTELLANAENADISGDGLVNTYDVHQFLQLYQSAVEVPAGGSVTVEVTIALTDEEKALLDVENPTGAYVQAFVRALPLATAEGALLPTLGIPVLGWYGNWSDPSMFDVGTQITHATGEESRASYLNNVYGNAIGIVYGDNPRDVWYFGGNPVVPDAHYIPERNAINTQRGDYFYQWSYAPVRSASALRFSAVNTTTGETLASGEGGAVYAAYYYVPYGSWMNTPQYWDIDLAPDLEVGEHGLLSLTLAPEYYVEDGVVDWDTLGEGATMEVPFTVDNMVPQIQEVTVDLENNVMLVTACDDQYLAGVLLYDVTGQYLLASAGTTADATSGQTITFSIPLDSVDGYKFIIQVADYAANFATYELRQTIGEPAPLPTRLAYDESFQTWSTFGKDDYYWSSTEWFASSIIPNAATAVGEYALVCDITGSLYAVPIDDMLNQIYIRKLGYTLTDMAYDASTDTVYGITEDSLLLSVDKLTGETRELGAVAVDTNNLANDGNGTFYCTTITNVVNGYSTDYRFDLYTFTLDETGAPTEPVLVGSPYTGYAQSSGVGALEYDPVNEILSMFARIPSYSYDYSYYFEIDPATGTSLLTDYYPPTPFTKGAVALIFPQWGADGSAWTEPTDQASSVAFQKDEVEVLLDLTTQVRVDVLPWNLTDKSVVFTSADENIATVDENGVVTGVSIGSTTIRATSVLDETVYDECTVVVDQLRVTVDGILCDEAGTPRFYSWNMEGDSACVPGDALDNFPMAVTRVPDTDTFYLLDSNRGTMHLLDNTGKDVETPSDYYYQYNYWIWDLAYSDVFGDTPALYGIRENAFLAPFDPMNPEFVIFNLGMYGVSHLAGITSGGYELLTYKNYYGEEEIVDSEVLYLIDDNCNVWRCNMFLEFGYRYSFVYSVISTDLDVSYPANFSGRSSLVLGEDGALYFSAWTGSTNELYRLVYDETTETYVSTFLGDFGEDVWPAVILDVSSNSPTVPAAPQGTRLHTQEIPGSLDAIAFPETDEELDTGVQVDTTNCTVTVPVVAQNSTNGLFTVNYDTEALTLVNTDLGSVMYSYDDSVQGTVLMGYADAGSYDGTLLNLVFSYTAGKEEQITNLTVTVLEDGETASENQQTVTITLPALPEDPEIPTDPFEDVDADDWFYEDVAYVYENGMMQGISETRFGPNAAANRAMIATILYRLAGSPAYTIENPYVDVLEGTYYYDAVLWCTENGVFIGYGDDIFGPTRNVTREQLATVLYRYTGNVLELDVSQQVDLSQVYTDHAAISNFAKAGLAWASAVGLVKGYPNGTVLPRNSATRGEIAAMFHRYCRNILGM